MFAYISRKSQMGHSDSEITLCVHSSNHTMYNVVDSERKFSYLFFNHNVHGINHNFFIYGKLKKCVASCKSPYNNNWGKPLGMHFSVAKKVI